MSVLSLKNTIHLMIVGGLVAAISVIVHSCQPPQTSLDRFAKASLRKLTVLETPPVQPNLQFSTPDGTQMQFSDFRGKVILLNVWATWCPPCIAEMPTLNALQVQRSSDDFEVVIVSLDRTAEEAADWLVKNDIDALTPYHDSSYNLPARLELPGLPTSVIYDRQGRELARLSGEADWTSPEALALIDALME